MSDWATHSYPPESSESPGGGGSFLGSFGGLVCLILVLYVFGFFVHSLLLPGVFGVGRAAKVCQEAVHKEAYAATLSLDEKQRLSSLREECNSYQTFWGKIDYYNKFLASWFE